MSVAVTSQLRKWCKVTNYLFVTYVYLVKKNYLSIKTNYLSIQKYRIVLLTLLRLLVTSMLGMGYRCTLACSALPVHCHSYFLWYLDTSIPTPFYICRMFLFLCPFLLYNSAIKEGCGSCKLLSARMCPALWVTV